jgi:exosortase/archaeosortase family protein
LIAFLAVQILHRKTGWKILHFAFIVPAIIIGNSLRIVLTVWLFNLCGEAALQNTWHTVLGYVQIIIALLFFLAIGKIFRVSDCKDKEEQP